MPIKLRRGPDPKTSAVASKIPMPTAKNRAVDTEDSCSFSTALLVEGLLAFFAMSSATKEVATLRRGILKSFEIMLKSEMDTPAEPNSTAPEDKLCVRGKNDNFHHILKRVKKLTV